MADFSEPVPVPKELSQPRNAQEFQPDGRWSRSRHGVGLTSMSERLNPKYLRWGRPRRGEAIEWPGPLSRAGEASTTWEALGANKTRGREHRT